MLLHTVLLRQERRLCKRAGRLGIFMSICYTCPDTPELSGAEITRFRRQSQSENTYSYGK